MRTSPLHEKGTLIHTPTWRSPIMGEQAPLDTPLIGDAPCADCGRDPHIWSAPSWLWNMVMDVTNEREAIICPLCFMFRTEQGYPMIWRLSGIDVDGVLPDAPASSPRGEG